MIEMKGTNTMKELMGMIGKVGRINCNGWTIPVVVEDVKKVFGTEKLLVISRYFDTEAQWINRDSFTEVN